MTKSRRRPGHKNTMEDVMLSIIRDRIKIKEDERVANYVRFKTVLDEIITLARKNDIMFDSMKPTVAYLGSYFDGLRVGKATEYDTNIVFTFPVDYKKIVLDAKMAPDAFTHIFMPSEFRRLSKNSATVEKGFQRTKHWCDSNYRISVQKFRSWLQSVLDATLKTLPTENGKKNLQCDSKYYQLTTKMSGPAFTITIYEKGLKDKIDLDLVAAFVFELPKLVQNSAVLFDKVRLTKARQYFVIPKPSTDSCCWRLSFPYQEMEYLYDTGNMKNVIKLMKLFRDVQGFHGLASYFIKTLFLWETNRLGENKKEFWRRNSLSYLFLHMLEKLRDNLREGRISNFWCPSHNLLEKLKPATWLNWSNRVSFILNYINTKCVSNPYVLLDFFTHKRKCLPRGTSA